jgi:hypothetical protein
MDWIEPFYTKRSEWMGPTGIFASHRARAASIERYSGAGKKRSLELGAGAGGTAAAMADLGHSVIAVELSPLRASFARELAEERDEERGLMRGYDFDPIGGRFLDQWWPIGDKSQFVTQTVRCYTPADFILLIEGTGLAVEIFAVDGNTFRADERSTVAHPLWDAFSYVVKLVLAS